MGFETKWVNWMRWCISSIRFSVLLNGSPVGFFQSSRGLRQGDPLSPFLFIIAMEALSSILKRALQGGYLEGFMAGGRGGEGVVVSHLLFADDTLVFCDASKEHVEVLSWVFMWFEAISGLKINLHKSEADSRLPLGAAFKSSRVWDVVEERFQKRLAFGRDSICPKEEGEPKAGKDSKRLPLGGGVSQSKPHLVDKALLGKWCWRFASEQDSLWKQVIVRKFGEEDGGWCSGDSRESHGVGLWKTIRKGWLEFNKRVAFKVGDGRRVRFWKDRWCGEDSLDVAFPRLYNLAFSKDVWVAQLWDQSGNLGCWNPVFTRLNNDWEMEEVETFFRRLHGHALRRGIEDVMYWRVSKKDIFTVKSFFSSLAPCIGREFPSSLVWNPWVPKRVSFFAWEAIWGRILTMDQLKRRGWALPSRCYLCKADEESANHVIHCPKATMICTLFLLFLVFIGFCPILSRKPFLVGTTPLLERKKKGVESTLYAYFGRYGRKEIEEYLKILN
ncbi:putative mitochondrial protein [Vitis vinifera]|uniref:Putative mitochondrial protein n=1 Tax=Vitis vinifera TaxID=29760 RepID=A0A438GJH4_VITVI|nr:putative mitochondrial protein [Vitis vinifera]